MLLDGFKFGMLLQFAIGPVCIFIFQLTSLYGFYIGEIGVLGVTLVDGFYITAAALGIASIIDKKNIRIFLKIFSAAILFFFGISTILSQFNVNFLPSLSLLNITNSSNVFIRAVIITASNPLTIIFWAGIFSAKLTEEKIKRQDIYPFGFGALLSTMFFLTLIALIGNFANTFLPTNIIQILNIIVGFFLICFGIKMIAN